MEVIKNKRILAIIGIAGLVLSCFFPYFKISILGYSRSISLWGYWEGKIIVLLALANALFIFQDFIEKYIPQLFNNWIGSIVKKTNNPKFSLIPTILVAVFAISLIMKVDVDFDYIKYGLGFYILWIGILSLIGHAIFYRKANDNLQQPTQQPTMNPQNVQPIQQPTMSPQNVQPMQQPTMNPQNVQPMQQPTMNPQNVQPMQQQTELNKKYCPNCGNCVNADAEVCFMCGNKF